MPEANPPMRVLLIDDDPDDRFLIIDMLQRLGERNEYEIDTASTFDEALAKLALHEHDVALVDFQLGASTGVDLLAATDSDPRRPPMIVLTGHGSYEIDRMCLEAGAADFLVKAKLEGESLSRSLRYAVERNRLSALLTEREQEYRTLFDASPMAMWVYDPDTLKVLQVNDAAIAQYGYDRAEFLALRVVDLCSDDDRAGFLEYHNAPRMPNGHQYFGIWRDRCRDGSLIDVEIVRRDIRFGNTMARLTVSNNVTAKLRAESALRSSEATLRQVLHDAADGLLVASEDQRILFANPVACQILGRPEADLLDSEIPESLRGSSRDSVIVVDSFDVAHEIELSVSDTQWNGAAARVLVLHDVTSQRSNAKQLLLLGRAVESTNDGLLITDMRKHDQPIIYVNPAFERITGYRLAEIVGRNCRFLQGDDRDQEAVKEIRAAIAQERDCDVELRNYRKDGSLFWNRLTLSPVRESTNEVSHYVAAISDITRQKQLEAERLYLATYDTVTGLPKYVGSEDRIDVLMQRMRTPQARALKQRLVFLFIDLDNFNSINDTMGFAMGDAALRHMAERLRDAAGLDAEVLRYAGDEFLVVIDGVAGDADLLSLATSYCDVISQPMPISSVATLYLSASVGASAYPDTGTTIVELTRQAEIATNRAKRSGRNGAFVFSHDLQEALGDRMALGGRMRDALARGEFLLHYQPQVNAQDGALTGVEALVRWNSPEFGLLPPRRFVPIAEDSGMILQLGAWVLRSACRQLRAWMDAGLGGFVVSVNVSAAQLQRPSFVEDVRRTIEETGIDPGMLELELTESVLMGNADRAVAQMLELKRLGMRLALDDFGMGYSSLSYLRRFPIDKLKIDQSFIANVVHEGNDAALVRAMISIGHHLGLRVVAEGVETAAQLGYLRRSHCDEFQGHYFAQALPADEIPDLVRKRFLMPSTLSDDAQARTLLILDDEDNIRRSLMRLLRRDGYQILVAATAGEAFELLATHQVQVILSDQRMPGMSGTEFLSQVKEMYPETVRMVLSGFTDLASVTEAINRGAIYKFLTKPWDDEALRAQVLAAFRRYDTIKGQ
jgi:diguanylate cyclase (GGDEF)-like protein/PAS domain S-box-containing protein